MQLFHMHARRRRARRALLVLALGISALGASFFEAQVIETLRYTVQSDANRLRPLAVPAPRGTVYDRNGEILADNVPGFALLVLPTHRDSLRATLSSLQELVELSPARVNAALATQAEFPNQPVVVSSDLTFDQVSVLEERRALFPRVLIERRPKRRYPGGAATAHVLGYVAEIDRIELQREEFAGYEPGEVIGKTGVERQYESVLGGEPGVRYVEVDALGRVLGDRSTRPEVEPTPGTDLRLSLDLSLQQWIAEALPDSVRGAVVALEPGTSRVLALYSQPSYDPNDFVEGVAPELWRELLADTTDPLVNRATAGAYAPGSTFKLVTAAAALEQGTVRPTEYMQIPCRGGMQYGNRYFRCWEREGHGYLSLPGAIQHSCNVYFYQLGVMIGMNRLLESASRMGFGRRTGIDLPGEVPGIFPTSVAAWEERWGAPSPTDVLNIAIGQSRNAQTALRLAQFYSALAADGRAAAPRLAASEQTRVEPALDLHVSPANLRWLREGMRGVVSEEGTAGLARLEHWELMGKTGTAQTSQDGDHAWFVGMAGPREGEPEVVVAAIIEFAGSGWIAAQYAAKAADYYLRRKHDMPIDTIQTLRDHLLAGRPAPWATAP